MALVKNIRRVQHKGKVHDLCVENTHTYNIEGLAVHNSAAGSLVSYCLGLTDVDPIEYGLLFERFLDEDRTDSMPDIDTDFDPRIRDWVKQHIVELFGTEKVCSIGTYSTYKTRAVILDVARALGENLAEVSAVTKRIEPLKSFEDEDGDEQKIDQMDFEDVCLHYPELKDYFDAHPDVLIHAQVLRNQVKNMGTHAGGVIISEMNLQDRIPVLYDKPSSENRKIISAWAESGSVQELSSVGLVKYDILGLKNLPIISDCVALIEKTTGLKLARADIPINDREAIYLGSKKDLVGIFQFENPQTKPIAEAVGMESLMDIAVVTSLIRPGPMDAEINGVRMPMEYARRKHGGEYESPEFIRKSLAETYSLLVFQENCMLISRVLSGFTSGGANALRKAAGKKLKVLMDSIREKFISGAQPRIDAGEITKEEVVLIWEQLETFSGYGFNKSVDIDTPVWCNGAVKKAGEVVVGDSVVCFDGNEWVKTDVVANHDHGVLPAFEVTFDGGEKVVCSIRHKFETKTGKVPLWQLILNGEVLCVKKDERLGVYFLYGFISDKKVVGSSQEPESKSSNTWIGGDCNMQGMRGEVSKREGLSETSEALPTSKGCFSTKQTAKSFGEHQEGSKCCISNDSGRSNCQCSKGRSDSSRDVECDCHTKQDIGEIKSDARIQAEGIAYGNSDLEAGRLAFTERQEFKALGDQSSTRVVSEFTQGTNGCEEIESRRVALERIDISSGRIPSEDSGSLLGNSKGSGLCESDDMDRGGRVLAFRNGICQEEISINQDSRKGCSSKSGSGETGDITHPTGTGLLEGEREVQVEGRMVEDTRETFGWERSRGTSTRKVLSARFVGVRRMCDLEVSHSSHNYVLANGIVSSNSHAVTYGAISTVELWLKHHFPIQFITALLNNTKLGAKKLGSSNLLKDYISYARRREIPVLGPDINKSGESFRVEGNNIRYSLRHVKNIAKAAKLIESFQPFTSMEDFYNRVKIEPKTVLEIKPEIEDEGEEESEVKTPDMVSEEDTTEETEEDSPVLDLTIKKPAARRVNRRVVENLIAAGAFDCFGNRNEMSMAYWRLRRKPSKKDRLKVKLGLMEDNEKVANDNFIKAQEGGDEKEIKKTAKAIVKAKAEVGKVKAAIIHDEKVDEAIAATPGAQEAARKKKSGDEPPPEDKTEEEWQAAEADVIGICLSRPILYKEYEERIRKEEWYLINEIDPIKKKILVFGQIAEIKQHISQAGNSMHIVHITDGIDSMRFFVFQGGWDSFKDNFKVGTIGVIPLARFEEGDGGTRFFDDRGKHVILKKE